MANPTNNRYFFEGIGHCYDGTSSILRAADGREIPVTSRSSQSPPPAYGSWDQDISSQKAIGSRNEVMTHSSAGAAAGGQPNGVQPIDPKELKVLRKEDPQFDESLKLAKRIADVMKNLNRK